MYEYAVIFTNQTSKYAILVKSAKNAQQALQIAIERANTDERLYTSVEAVYCI